MQQTTNGIDYARYGRTITMAFTIAAAAGCAGAVHAVPALTALNPAANHDIRLGADNQGLSNNVRLSVTLPKPGEVVTKSVLSLYVTASGYRLDARYAGTPNLRHIGHYHEILDGKLVDMTPLVGPNADTVSMVGVARGPHVLTLVPANNDHSIVSAAAVNTSFSYAGRRLPLPDAVKFAQPPSITITSPAKGSKVRGSFNMSATVAYFKLCQVCFGKRNVDGIGHWHIFVDKLVMSNMLTMAGSGTQEVFLDAVTPGWHTFWAVVVDDQHMPFMNAPTTMTSVKLYVQPKA